MLKLLILDVDGVLTDGTKYYDKDGNVVLKIFCDKDWTAIKRFRAIGVNVVFLTGDSYNVSILRKRNLDVVVNRGNGFHTDKSNYLVDILKKYNCSPDETAYIGDDLFDIGIMNLVGYPCCVLNSPSIVKENAKTLDVCGGDNVVMNFFDMVEREGLIPKVKYDDVMSEIYELDVREKF